MHATEDLEEADRLMTVCNSCRYCEGLCAVFPAMEMRRSFSDADLNYLANLCHACGACYVDCQFSPPHEFNVNVPKTLAQVRAQTYRAYAWPGPLRFLFARNGLALALVAVACVLLFVVGFVVFDPPGEISTPRAGPGAFYDLMPHAYMAALFGAAFLYSIGAIAISLTRFWTDIGAPVRSIVAPRALAQAGRDSATLKYLDGGGVGCYNAGERPTDRRRLFHHLTFYGFILCFLATCVATVYHYAGYEAPYPWWQAPVLLGILGGLGLISGTAGLIAARLRRDRELVDEARTGMDMTFVAVLFFTALSGFALLLGRATPAMGFLLALHLGLVFALFVTMPYSKFVHGFYRVLALARYAKERKAMAEIEDAGA